MIVTLLKLYCPTCCKIRWHEKIHSAYCFGCKNYNLSEPVMPVAPVKTEIQIVRWN